MGLVGEVALGIILGGIECIAVVFRPARRDAMMGDEVGERLRRHRLRLPDLLQRLA